MKDTWIRKYLLSPAYSGLMGFAAFFTILVITELLKYTTGEGLMMQVDSESLLLSLIGFGGAFVLRIITNFKHR